MGNSFTIYSFFALLGCLLAGMFFAWLLYGRSSSLSKPLRAGLALIRAVTVTLILWLLFSPLIKQVSYTLEKPIVIIAQDNSQSAGAIVSPGFDRTKYQHDLQQLSKELSEKYEVRAYSFSDKITSGLDFSYKGKLTNAAALVSRITDEFTNRNVGAVILATDGIFNRGGNPADISALKAPVYTIALGDTIPKKDVLVANVNSNDLVYLDNDFKLEVQVQAYQCKDQRTRLKVTEDGKTVYDEPVKFSTNIFSKYVPVKLKASKLGQHRYTVSVSGIAGEISDQNNTQQVLIEVIDDRQKILIAAAAPHPDIAALNGAISANKHNEVSIALNEGLLKTDPEKYALIILYQLPGLQFDARAFTDKIRISKVPVWYILGAQSSISKFNQVQSMVNFAGNNGSLQHTYSDINKNVSAFDLDASAEKTIGSFDPLQAPSGQLKTLGSAESILNQRTGKTSTDLPQLFFMNDNGRKTGYLIGEGVWKWKLSEARESAGNVVFNDLISKTVQYLSVKDDKRKFKVYPAKQAFDENEHILLNATLYNDSYQPVNTPDVNLELKDEKGKSYRYTFSKFESSYQLDAGILPPGNYSYTANTALGNQKYQAKGSFFIHMLNAEFQQTIANHHLLYQLSNQTNGKLYAPDRLLSIKNDLDKSEQMKTLSYEDRKYEELVNLKWLFVLLLILLSTEWFLRKRNAAL